MKNKSKIDVDCSKEFIETNKLIQKREQRCEIERHKIFTEDISKVN